MSLVESWSLNQTTTVEVAHPGVQGPPGSGGGGAVDSVNGRTGAVTLTSADVGLSNVNNTSDADKPVSTAQAAADAAVLASANATTAAHAARTDNPHTVTAAQLGLGNVENKSSATIRSEITSGNVTAALGYTPENAAQKGAAGGYAPLDGTGKVASTYLPSYVDDVLEYANLAAFPGTGETGKMYVALDTNKVYRWSGSAYVEISGSPGSTDAVPEGASNLYFTAARVLATVLSGLSTATNAVITAADTVLSALGKLQKQISDNLTTLTSHTSNTSNPHGTTAAQVGAAASGAVTTSGLTMSTARLLGRSTATTGAVEEITPGANLSLAAGSLSVTPSGDNKQIQYNNAGSFAGMSGVSWNNSERALTIDASGGDGTQYPLTLKTSSFGGSGILRLLAADGTQGLAINAFYADTWVWDLSTKYTAVAVANKNIQIHGEGVNTGVMLLDAWLMLNGNSRVMGSAPYASVGTPLTECFPVRFNAFYWNGVDGYSGSIAHVGAKQKSATDGDAAVVFADGSNSVKAEINVLTGNIKAVGVFQPGTFTVATLPSASANPHAIAVVTDATSITYRGSLTGGGSTKGLVYSDGSSWMGH